MTDQRRSLASSDVKGSEAVSVMVCTITIFLWLSTFYLYVRVYIWNKPGLKFKKKLEENRKAPY
jgi:hypothetical protein